MNDILQPPLWMLNLSGGREPIKTADGRKVYYLAERPMSNQALKVLGMRQLRLEEYNLKLREIMAVRTGSFRPPKRDEWYLSGAIPAAYRAPNDLGSPYHIMKLVRVRVTIPDPIIEIINE